MGGDGWVHPNGANSMVVSRLRKALVGTWRAIVIIFFLRGHRKSHLTL